MAEIAEIQKGVAKLFGITNDGTAYTIDAFATFVMESAGLTHNFDLLDDKDATNFDVTAIATNANVRAELTLQPSGATRAAAAAVAVFLTPLASVVTTHFKLAALSEPRCKLTASRKVQEIRVGAPDVPPAPRGPRDEERLPGEEATRDARVVRLARALADGGGEPHDRTLRCDPHALKEGRVRQ